MYTIFVQYIINLTAKTVIHFDDYVFFDQLSLYTIGENISYMIHKYQFDVKQWYGSITPLFNNIDVHITSHTVIKDRCTDTAIEKLSSIRDIIDHLPLTTKL